MGPLRIFRGAFMVALGVWAAIALVAILLAALGILLLVVAG
jgi:hypothetical protein